jgi:hypothetical protein
MVMLRRRTAKIFARPVNKIQRELWFTEFFVVFHLTAVLHKYDSRLVTNLKPNIR